MVAEGSQGSKVALRPGTPQSCRQEDAEEGHADHAGEDRRAQRAAHFGAGALTDMPTQVTAG
jgi:hypothetical protein